MSANRSSMPFVAAAAIGLVVLGTLCSYQLHVTEFAIVTTLGKPAVAEDPGLHWRLPWPIQKVTTFDNRKQLFSGPARETATEDNINIIVKLFASWHVTDPLKFFNSVGSHREAEVILQNLLNSSQENVLRSRSFSDLVSHTAGPDRFVEIESEIRQQVNAITTASHGLTLATVGIARICLHESNTTSVLARMKQEQANTAAEITSTGNKEAKIIRDNAESLKEQEIAKAEAEARRIRGDAMITAAEQYDKFKDDVAFAVFLRKLDALEETMKTKTTIILDSTTPPYDLLKYENE